MRTLWIASLIVVLAGLGRCAEAQSSRSRRDRGDASRPDVSGLLARPATAPSVFAPVADGHPLATVWNDPDFVRRLIGSYGFLSEAEPRLSADEQAFYRDRIVPLLRQDPPKAIPELLAAIQPGASAVFDFTLGTVYFQTEDFTNAVTHYEQAVAKFPDYRRAHQNLGLVLVRDGKYAEAIGPLTRAVALGGADGRIFGLLGFAYLNQNRYLSALGAYQQAMVFEPSNLDFKLGLVKCHIGLNQWDAAIAILDELIEDHPEREALWSLQANVFIQREQPLKAIVNLEILRHLGKANAAQLALLGDLYLTQDDRDPALAAYLAAVEADGERGAARGLRPAEILLSRGAVAEAGALLDKVRGAGGLDGEQERKRLKLEARLALATGKAEEGIAALESLVSLNPLDGEALLLAGDFYARHGQPEKAALRYDAAAKLEGFEADALLKDAQLKVQLQKYTEAVELLRRAQRLQPRDHVARYLEKVEQAAARARS